MARSLVEELPGQAEPRNLVATIVSAMDRLNEEGKKMQREAFDLCVRDRAVLLSEAPRVMCRTWADVANVEGSSLVDIGDPLTCKDLGIEPDSSTGAGPDSLAPGQHFGEHTPRLSIYTA